MDTTTPQVQPTPAQSEPKHEWTLEEGMTIAVMFNETRMTREECAQTWHHLFDPTNAWRSLTGMRLRDEWLGGQNARKNGRPSVWWRAIFLQPGEFTQESLTMRADLRNRIRAMTTALGIHLGTQDLIQNDGVAVDAPSSPNTVDIPPALHDTDAVPTHDHETPTKKLKARVPGEYEYGSRKRFFAGSSSDEDDDELPLRRKRQDGGVFPLARRTTANLTRAENNTSIDPNTEDETVDQPTEGQEEENTQTETGEQLTQDTHISHDPTTAMPAREEDFADLAEFEERARQAMEALQQGARMDAPENVEHQHRIFRQAFGSVSARIQGLMDVLHGTSQDFQGFVNGEGHGGDKVGHREEMDAVQRNISDEEASHTRANTRESQELIIPTTRNYKPPSTDAHLSLFNGMVDGGVWTQGIRNLIIDANVRHLLHPRDAV